MTKALVVLAASASVVAVAMTGTVYASRSHSVASAAIAPISLRQPDSARIETRPITFAEALPSAIGTEAGFFIGTGDGNGIWIQY